MVCDKYIIYNVPSNSGVGVLQLFIRYNRTRLKFSLLYNNKLVTVYL